MSPAAKKYYAGGIRFVRDGVPCRMASWVNDLTDVSRADMLRDNQCRNGATKKCREATAQARHPQTTYLPLEAFQ